MVGRELVAAMPTRTADSVVRSAKDMSSRSAGGMLPLMLPPPPQLGLVEYDDVVGELHGLTRRRCRMDPHQDRLLVSQPPSRRGEPGASEGLEEYEYGI